MKFGSELPVQHVQDHDADQESNQIEDDKGDKFAHRELFSHLLGSHEVISHRMQCAKCVHEGVSLPS